MLENILKTIVPQKLINFLIKIRDFLKGKKTYIAASVLLLEALLSYLNQAIDFNTMADFAAWIQGLASNPASLKAAEALALFGIRAAIAKKQ